MDESDVSYVTKRDLQTYMDKKCFKGFNKSPQNDDFFSVFGALFTRLDKEEELEEGVGTKHREAQKFGDIDSSREDVMKFYQEWSGFSTLKQFAYVDQYNPNDAPNRRIKRLIE